MEGFQNSFLTDHYLMLTASLRDKVRPVLKYIYEEELVSRGDAEVILSHAANSQKMQKMLDILKGNPAVERTLDGFYSATLYAKVPEVSDLLKPVRRPHKDDVTAVIPLPDEWPSEAYLQLMNEGDMENAVKFKTVDTEDKKMKDCFYNPDGNQTYNMNNKVKGRVLIISNDTFEEHTKLEKRDGTGRDAKWLAYLLEQLKFTVKVETNKKAKEMDKLISDECGFDHTNFNCFMLVLLSHGSENVVYGTDGHSLFISNIEHDILNVKTLAKKPKILIIQACRQSQTQLAESSEQQDEFYSREVIDFDRKRNSIQAPAHLLRALPNTEGSKSWRNPSLGSWFIQAFIWVVANYSYAEDLSTLMTKVTALVQKCYKNDKNEKQTPQTKSSFMKKLYFFPGLEKSEERK